VNFSLPLRQNCKIMENKGKKIYIYVAVLLVLGLLLLFKTCGSNKNQHEMVAQNQELVKVVEEPAVSQPVDTVQYVQVAQPVLAKPILEKKKIKTHKT
jgi:cytoskeletal protein RodZ